MGVVVSVSIFIYTATSCQMLTQIMYAEHETFWPSIYPIFAPIWTTIVLLIAWRYELNSINFLIFVLAFSNIIIPLHAASRLNICKNLKFNIRAAWNQIFLSKDQLLFAILSAITLSVDYLVMSRILTALDIVNYTLVSRVFTVLLVIHGVMLAASWTPIADLMHSFQKKEARKKIEQVLKQGLTIGLIAGFMIFYGIDYIARLLTGGVINGIPLDLSLCYWVYILIRIWTDTYAMALHSCGQVSVINKFIPLQALISVIGQYYFGVEFGTVGVIIGLIVSFVLTSSWIIPFKFYSLTRV